MSRVAGATEATPDSSRDSLVLGDVSAPFSTDGTWSLLSANPGLPEARSTHSAIYDPVRRRMVVFGGGGTTYLNDTWALWFLSPAFWAKLPIAGPWPAPRRLHGAVYDSARDRMIVFGGFDGSYFNDVWALSLSGTPAWAELHPAGPLPAGRADFAMVYDPAGDRVVVFGGYDGVSPPSNRRGDLWALSLSGTPAWAELHPAGPVPTARSGHRAIYDPVRQQMVVVAGYDVGFVSDVWALELSGAPAWIELQPSGSIPPPRADHSVVYDPYRDRIAVHSGFNTSLPGGIGDTWMLALAGGGAWSPGPSWYALWGQSAIYDPLSDRMIVFGGANEIQSQDVLSALTWDLPTPVQLSLVRAAASPGSVRLEWTAMEPLAATLERREEEEAWQVLATIESDPSGRIVWEDRAVRAGVTYSYRLGIVEHGREIWLGEVTVTVPLVALAIQSLTPAERAGMAFRITLPEPGPARLEVLDVAGRRVFVRDVGGEAGTRTVELEEAGAVPAGLYFARLEQGGRTVTTRAARIR